MHADAYAHAHIQNQKNILNKTKNESKVSIKI